MTLQRGAFALTLVLLAAPLHAQVPWESPQLLSPASPAGLSVFYVDYGLRPNDGTGLLMLYRTQNAPAGFGVRVASTIPDGDDGDRLRVSGGVDVAVPMLQHSATFPLDVIWTSGLGASYGHYASVALPVGFAAGRALSGEHIWFNPWLSTRVVFETYIGGGRPDEHFGTALASDIGIDLAFDEHRRVMLRTALSLGDRRAIVIGLSTSRR